MRLPFISAAPVLTWPLCWPPDCDVWRLMPPADLDGIVDAVWAFAPRDSGFSVMGRALAALTPVAWASCRPTLAQLRKYR